MRAGLRTAGALALVASACGGGAAPEPVRVATPEPPPTAAVASARGLPVRPDAWPQPAGDSDWRLLADGDPTGPAFVAAEGTPSPQTFVVAFDDGELVDLAALVVWSDAGERLEVSVSTSLDGYPLVDDTWVRFMEAAVSRGAADVTSPAGEAIVLALPEPVRARRAVLGCRGPQGSGCGLTEISALAPAALEVARSTGARVVTLDDRPATVDDAASPPVPPPAEPPTTD